MPFLPLHWFVYSLGSQVLQYKWINHQTKEVITGDSGLAHQEKNWGKGFPPAWIWAEGVEGTSGTSFAVSLGVLDIAHLDLPAHLIGYRSPKFNFNFRPTNSILKKSISGCEGQVTVTVTSLLHQVVIEMSTAPSTLQTCLLGPTEVGFAPVCVESCSVGLPLSLGGCTCVGTAILALESEHRVVEETRGDYISRNISHCGKKRAT